MNIPWIQIEVVQPDLWKFKFISKDENFYILCFVYSKGFSQRKRFLLTIEVALRSWNGKGNVRSWKEKEGKSKILHWCGLIFLFNFPFLSNKQRLKATKLKELQSFEMELENQRFHLIWIGLGFWIRLKLLTWAKI